MKLLLVILEGQLYLAGIVAIFVAELAFLFWGLWSRRPIIGLVAVFVTVPLIRSTVSAIRACFFRIEPPEGLALARTEGRALYDLVEDIRRAVEAPPVDSVTITGGFNASAVVVQSILGPLRRRRTLVLGLPVLTTLSTGELRAVIAHELAHFSGAHDPYAAWVYRTHRSWVALRAALDRRLATPVYVYWFIRWYVPRLYAASADVARHHEFVADAVAAKVAGSRATADALVAFESGARFEDCTHWPKVDISYETDAEPPRPYSQMLTWNARVTSTEVLDELLSCDTEPKGTHPSLPERLARLDEAARTPPSVCSAGEELLGPELERLAARLDRRWGTENGEAWHRHRAEYRDRRASLERLAALDTPTPDQLFKRAELVETLESPDQALPIYQAAAELGHPAASLAAGRALLDRMDSTGIRLVEAAMDHDDRLVPEACRILAEYYRETNQELAARKCEWRATRHTTRARLAERAQTLNG